MIHNCYIGPLPLAISGTLQASVVAGVRQEVADLKEKLAILMGGVPAGTISTIDKDMEAQARQAFLEVRKALASKFLVCSPRVDARARAACTRGSAAARSLQVPAGRSHVWVASIGPGRGLERR